MLIYSRYNRANLPDVYIFLSGTTRRCGHGHGLTGIGQAGIGAVEQGLHAVDRALATVPLRVLEVWSGKARCGEHGRGQACQGLVRRGAARTVNSR